MDGEFKSQGQRLKRSRAMSMSPRRRQTRSVLAATAAVAVAGVGGTMDNAPAAVTHTKKDGLKKRVRLAAAAWPNASAKNVTAGVLAAASMAAAVILQPRAAFAADVNWISSSNGLFSAGSNWLGGQAPGTSDFAHFAVAGSPPGPAYTVSFASSPTNRGTYVHNDNVTLSLGGNTYSQNGSDAFDPLVVGQVGGESGSLTVNNGTLSTSAANSSLFAVIGKNTGATGAVTVNTGASWFLPSVNRLSVAQQGHGTLTVNTVALVNDAGHLIVGDDPGGVGSVTISGDLAEIDVTGETDVGDQGTGTLTLSAKGILKSKGSAMIADSAGASGTVNINNQGMWQVTGDCSVGGTHTAAGGTGVFNINAGGSVTVSGIMRIWDTGSAAPGGTRLTLAGGSLTTGQLLISNLNRFDWSSGILTLTGMPLDVQSAAPLGDNIVLNSSMTFVMQGHDEMLGDHGNGTFTQTGGTHSITSGGVLYLALNSGATGQYLLQGGTLNTGNVVVGNSGAGAFTQSGGTHTVTGALTIAANAGSSGNYTISAGSLTTPTLQVKNTGTFNYNGGTLNVTDLQLSENAMMSLAAGAARVLRLATITISNSAKLDLRDNKLIVQSTAPATITSLIASGRNGGSWNGGGIITSQSAAAAGNLTTLGVAAAHQVKVISATQTALWAGQTVTGSDTLVMYTYGGDANLDGKINVDDYGRIDSSIALGIAGWYNGDFNYDGKINVDDYGIIDSNIGIQGAPFGTDSGSQLSQVVAVPEPCAVVTAVAAAGAASAGRSRRRRRITRPPYGLLKG